MKVDKIDSIVASYTNFAKNSKERSGVRQLEAEKNIAAPVDAVKVAPALSAEIEAAQRDEQRAERVAQIKEQVSSGTYRIDTRKLAEKLYTELFM